MSLRKHCKDFLEDKENPTVFELGVHWGEDTPYIASWCKGVTQYHGFEPDPRNLERIKEEWANWHPNNFQINLIDGAVSSEEGKGTLYLSDGVHALSGNVMTGANSLREPFEVINRFSWIDFSKTINVQKHTIDNYCNKNNISNIDFIWCDIQGCEYDMLLGAEKMLDNIGFMLLEYSDIELYKGQKFLKDILDLLGNKWELVAQDDWDIVVKNKEYKR